MFYSCVQSPVTVEVITLASQCSELIGNSAIVRKCNVIHKKVTCVTVCACVFEFPRVARKRKNAWATCGRLYE